MESLKKILTRRQFEAAGLVAKGLRNRDIGSLMGVKAATVKCIIMKIFVKAGCETRTALAVRYTLEEERGYYR